MCSCHRQWLTIRHKPLFVLPLHWKRKEKAKKEAHVVLSGSLTLDVWQWVSEEGLRLDLFRTCLLFILCSFPGSLFITLISPASAFHIFFPLYASSFQLSFRSVPLVL